MAGNRILLVEGLDDQKVVEQLCRDRGVVNPPQVKPQDTVETLLRNLPVWLKGSDNEIVGVLIDADTDLASRWRSLRDRLSEVGYPDVPPEPLVAGTILNTPEGTMLPRVGVWIMPNNQTTGILEDFLRFLVPQQSRLFAHVELSVAGIPEEECRFSQVARPKAIIHTWLAWQEKPGRPLGTAIKATFLDPDVSQVGVLVSWLNRLFFP